MLKQPRAVWAVAFACVIAFMGIGLVDPILKPIADELGASPSQVSLLFTSYMAVMGVAMLITGVVSSASAPSGRCSSGLVLIIVFSALAGASDTVGAIVGFRAGWGLGNALFIATACRPSWCRPAARSRQAIILFEAALGHRHRDGPARRRPARLDLLAGTVLRRRRADVDRPRRDGLLPAVDPTGRAAYVPAGSVPGAALSAAC